MFIRLPLFCFLLFAALPCFSQEPGVSKRTFRFYLGGGAAWETYRDRAMSPLLYEGIQGAAGLGFELEGKKMLHRWDGQFLFGNTSAQRRGGTTENLAFSGIGVHMWRLNPADAPWKWHAGPSLIGWGSLRYHTSLVNSNYFYDLFFSIGPSGSVERDFKFLKKRWSTGWQLTVPVLSWGLRPTYSGLVAATPEDELTANPYLAEAQFGFFNVLTRVHSRVHLRYSLPNENALLLIYNWDMYRSNMGYHPVTHALNALQLNLSVKLSR